MNDEEIEAMKRIDLRRIAAELGYVVNTRKSSRGSTAMDHADGDRIVIAIDRDGVFVWSSVRDGRGGTCIDLWQRRLGGSIGDVRKALRPFLERGLSPSGQPTRKQSTPPPLGPASLPRLDAVDRDLGAVRAAYEGFAPICGFHAYLCEQRGIPPEILSHPRIARRIRVDARGNAIFPHFDRSGVCGWEARNENFISFARGGIKGLWCSIPARDDQRLVMTEGAIDALSWAAIHTPNATRLVSFSGGLSKTQHGLLKAVIGKLASGAQVCIAVDNDEAGDRYLELIERLFHDAKRPDLQLRDDRPPDRGTDWNDVLRTTIPPPLSPDQGPGVG